MKNVTYINAGAGSGKTTELLNILLKLIKSGQAKPEQVILTTFTTKAADEFKEKAKAILYKNNMYDEAIRLDQAMIGTIHSICQRFIGKYWFNIGVSPTMGVMAEEDTAYYVSQSLAELPTENELKLLHSFCRSFDVRIMEDFQPKGLDFDFWQGHLKRVIEFSTNYEIDDFSKSEEESLKYIKQFVNSDFSISISESELDQMIREARAYVDASNRIKNKDEHYKKFDRVLRGSRDKNIAWYKDVKKTMDGKYGPTCTMIQERLEGIWTSKEVYDLQEKYIHLLFNLANRWKENFAEFKREKNLLDYDDMEKYMRLLMQDKDIANEIGKSYKYLFVDEFQDSSPIQVKIFDALSDLMRHSYWVGDYKQAIYGFRGSDIALTKAVVDRIDQKKDGCDSRTQRTSFRSLPDIVDVNNEVFCKTFANVLSKENIHLEKNRTNDEDLESLKYFVANTAEEIAMHVVKLIKEGAKPNEIAVLTRMNKDRSEIATALSTKYNVASSVEDMPVVGTEICILIESLLGIVNSSWNTLAKATVAILTSDGFSTKELIERKLLHDANGENADTFLKEIPLIAKVTNMKQSLQQQSIAAMIESMVIELNLYNVCRTFATSQVCIATINTIINTAKVYEEHCVQMNLPATIDGFIAYLEESNPCCSGDPDGVQLHTYHSCKGLQWKYVILASLNYNVDNENLIVGREIYGVHFVHSEDPSVDNPYPEIYVRLTPWVYGTSRNVPEEVKGKITGSKLFEKTRKSVLEEANRLLYVGMTRARDVMLLDIATPSKNTTLFKWVKDVGVDSAIDAIPEEGECDVFGNGMMFGDYTLTEEELDNIEPLESGNDDLQLRLDDRARTNIMPKYVSPSSIHTKGDVADSHSFDQRIVLKSTAEMAEVGNCIHQIYAGIEDEASEEKIGIDEIVKSYGLENVLIDNRGIADAWKNLCDYLTENFGKAVKTYHERPFRLERNYQIITGSIDLVWQTEDGDILVDFKTCPMGAKAVLDPDSDHYAGWYAGQLDAYQNALEEAGETVLKRFIYYPVSGILAEVTRSFEVDPPYKKSIFHVFGVEGVNLEELWQQATSYCSDDGFSGQIEVRPAEDNDEKIQEFHAILHGASTQGVIVTYIKDGGGHIHIDLPWLGMTGDVTLAFAFMKVLRNMFPDCEIFYNDEIDHGQFALREENYDSMLSMRLLNMKHLIESARDGNHNGAAGIFHYYIVPSKEDYPNLTVDEILMKAVNEFVESQWKYKDYEEAGNANVTHPSGEKYTVRILTNTTNTFVPSCQHVCFTNKKEELKDIPTYEFIKKMKNHPHFKMVDATQFVLDKMTEEEWEQMFDMFENGTIQDKTSENEHTDEDTFTTEVSDKIFNRILDGKQNYISILVDQNNYRSLLKNIDGHLALTCEELPDYFYECYFMNEGKFPYIVNDLKYINIINQRRVLCLEICGHSEHINAFGTFGKDHVFREDKKGEACQWEIRFLVKVDSYGGIPSDEIDNDPNRRPNYYILRWNPAISSVTLDDYHKGFEQNWKDNVFDWSIYEWEDAHMGDKFFMLRTGDDGAGIVYRGEFRSEPYIDKDWNGSTKPRHYCLYTIYDKPSPAYGEPYINLETLEEKIPEIDWRKGHSGQKISEEVADKIESLWNEMTSDGGEPEYRTKVTGKKDDEFDADQGHGSHLQCVDEDLDYVINSICKIVPKSNDVIGQPSVIAKNEGKEYEAQLILLSTDEKKDITFRSILETHEDGHELVSFFPYVVNRNAVQMTLKKIDEFSNGVEAVLTCEYENTDLSFFDMDYPLHKSEYKIGEKYNFALSAIAYQAEKVPEKEMFFKADPETVKKIYSTDPSAMPRDKNGDPKLEFDMSIFVACLQHDGKHPDDAEFWSPIQSKVRKTTIINRDFYCMDIMIYHDDCDENDLIIPFAAKTSFFEEKPTKWTSIRGYMWLQGRMI